MELKEREAGVFECEHERIHTMELKVLADEARAWVPSPTRIHTMELKVLEGLPSPVLLFPSLNPYNGIEREETAAKQG